MLNAPPSVVLPDGDDATQQAILQLIQRVQVLEGALTQSQAALAQSKARVSQLEQRLVECVAELQISRGQVAAILHNSLDGIFFTRPDLRIRQANAAFCTLFACEHDDYQGQPLLNFVQADDRLRVLSSIQTVLDTHWGKQLEIRAQRHDGALFEVELSIGALQDHGLICTIRDITERKAAQTRLAEERNLLRTLIDAMPDIIYVKDLQHRFVLCNTAAGDVLHNRLPEAIIGKTDADLFPPALAAQFHAEEEAIFATGEPVLRREQQVVDLDGNVIWISTTKVILQNLEGERIGLAGFSHDITARKRYEQQLRLSASLQENVSDGVITCNLDFLIQSWNRAAEAIYGWRADEVLGHSVAAIWKTVYTSELARQDARAWLFTHGAWSGELLQYRKNGEPVHVFCAVTVLKDEMGLPYGYITINRDITEQKRADAVQREHHDFLQLVIDSLPNIILVNDQLGRFQLVNQPAAQLYQQSPADMIGKVEAEVIPNQAATGFSFSKGQALFASQQPIFIPEEKIFGRYYQTSKIPLKNHAGAFDRLLTVATEITEHKRAEEALQQALHKEKELSELKSRFVSMASHEFRTPLAAIQVLVDTLTMYRQQLTDAQITQRLSKIQDQVSHLRTIMDEVLQLARLQARRSEFNPALEDLASLCRTVVEEFQSQVGGGAFLHYRCSPSLPAASLDRRLIRQVITNLVTNAIKYSPPDKSIFIDLTQCDQNLVLQVRDEGIGIPEADLPHLFEPFHRASNVGTIPGTGLGLVITKEAVELHGGMLTVTSQLGLGTTFTVAIPITITVNSVDYQPRG
ncbi:MAG: PAS domain-containing protein [Caldilineaceae bacterium]|nr:PAS domain-containing protein [Caldilineaceae bacterium]